MRPPSDALSRALSRHPLRDRIDPERARAEHAAYGRALEAAGVAVTLLPPEVDMPDACFTSDTCWRFRGRATSGRRSWWRPGPERRPGEPRFLPYSPALCDWPPVLKSWRSAI